MTTTHTLTRLAVTALCALAGCQAEARTVTTASGLRYQIIQPGTGPAARPGQSVLIHEIVTLANGTVIYNSRAKNTPVPFLLGGNQVIAGIDEGVTGMQVGERRKLVVPPALSIRSSYPAGTPPDSTLYIDLELVGISGPNQAWASGR